MKAGSLTVCPFRNLCRKKASYLFDWDTQKDEKRQSVVKQYSLLFKIMMLGRGKQSKSDTPSRLGQPTQKGTAGMGQAKRSDPFLKELKEVYDKQNIHPNLKENRTRSYQNHPNPDAKSPLKKIMHLKHLQKNSKAKDTDPLNSHSKYAQSSQLQRAAAKSRGSNRKSTEKDEPQPHFQEEYFPLREERREKKMKVTLKDLKRQRRSIQESDGQYVGKLNGETKESITQDTAKADSAQPQLLKNQHEREEISVHCFNTEPAKPEEYFCRNHPEKRATHLLLDSASSEPQNYCEKCAVGLATKGYQMTQIFPQESMRGVREERICELKDFLFELDKMQPLFRRSSRRVERFQAFLMGKYEEEGRRLEIYYNNLSTVLRNSYDSARQTLKMHFDAVMEEVEQQGLAVDAHAQEMAVLKEDILPNINAIIDIGKVTCESFRSVITHNYGRLAEAEQLVRQLTDYNCTYYQYRFENLEHLLVDLRSLISPVMDVLSFDPAFETERSSAPAEWLDPFRMSFGKHQGSAMRF